MDPMEEVKVAGSHLSALWETPLRSPLVREAGRTWYKATYNMDVHTHTYIRQRLGGGGVTVVCLCVCSHIISKNSSPLIIAKLLYNWN